MVVLVEKQGAVVGEAIFGGFLIALGIFFLFVLIFELGDKND